jgi:hypothetical protein
MWRRWATPGAAFYKGNEMKTALVIGVCADQTREVICCGADASESRQIVVDAASPGSESATDGYDVVELHMISRGTRVKSCKVNKSKVAQKAPKKDD